MGQIYNFLGLSVGVIVHGLDDAQRKAAYDCDITYGTNNELRLRLSARQHEVPAGGHGPARPHLRHRRRSRLDPGRRGAHAADHLRPARRPLRILQHHRQAYIPQLDKTDYEVDEKQRTVALTEAGMEKMETHAEATAGLLKGDSLYDVENVSTVHHVNQALRAHKLFQRDKDYIVRNGEVVIIDEFTGRMMPGRRYSEGLHQALEAKERQPIQPENQTLASITFQNYFRMYEKLAGMTGTAHDRSGRVHGHLQSRSDRDADQHAAGRASTTTTRSIARPTEKYRAIVTLIDDCKKRGQPVLVGTTSIEKSEQLAELLRQNGWEQHDFADPNAFAALYSAATSGPTRRRSSRSSTRAITSRKPTSSRRPACRARSRSPPTWPAAAPTSSSAATPTCASARNSTDIEDVRERDRTRVRSRSARRWRELKEKALAAGGLFVLGTERHESRRIDNQLRGRSGRQGDPGHSKFFLSLEDDLMRIFGSDKLDGMLTASSASRRTRRSSIPGSTRRWRRRSRRSRRATSTSARTC